MYSALYAQTHGHHGQQTVIATSSQHSDITSLTHEQNWKACLYFSGISFDKAEELLGTNILNCTLNLLFGVVTFVANSTILLAIKKTAIFTRHLSSFWVAWQPRIFLITSYVSRFLWRLK